MRLRAAGHMVLKHFIFMNEVGTGRYSSSVHHRCCSRQTDLRSSKMAVVPGSFVSRHHQIADKGIERDNQNAVLFIFEPSRMAFPVLRLQVERTARVGLAFTSSRLY